MSPSHIWWLSCGIRDQYGQALELLLQHKSRALRFPSTTFAGMPLARVAAAAHSVQTANVHSRHALEAASLEHSGFRRHSAVGLVTEQYDTIVKQLERLRAA
ncbi:MAG: hypothetical protein U1F35_03275 [Steroidobacteraceae bacterium]